MAKAARLKHPVEYQAWYNMKWRCLRRDAKDFPNYGGRGISVDPSWLVFARFYADMGPCPRGFTLDRIDNNQNYAPHNCRWATKTQQDNNRRSNRFLTVHGRTQTITQWAREYGVRPARIRERLKAGYAVAEVLSNNRLTIGRRPSVLLTVDDERISFAGAGSVLAIAASTLHLKFRKAGLLDTRV